MPSFSEHKNSTRTKLLMVGDSKSGKSAALATLANAGYKVNILDYDDGLDPLAAFLQPEVVDNVHYVTLKDDPADRKGVDSWRKGWNIIQGRWKVDDEDLGSIRDWGSDTVFVIDSLTFMGKAALHDALVTNGKKVSDQPSQPEWGDALRKMEALLDFVLSNRVNCNVVMTALPIAIDDESGVSKLYPQVVSKNFSTTVPSFFNNVIGLTSKRDGTRLFRTTSNGRQEFGVSKPMAAEVPADMGALFKELQGT